MNKKVRLQDFFSKDEIEKLKKLGYNIKNKKYSEEEYSTLRNNLVIDYYEDTNHDDAKPRKKLSDTGVSRECYNEILKKMDDIEWKYSQ